MSDLSKAIENLKFDKRMKDWNVSQKKITEEDFSKHQKSLKDISDLRKQSDPEADKDSPA